MKKTILSFAVLAFTAFVSNSQAQTTAPAPAAGASTTQTAPPNPNAPEIVFDNETIEYGTVKYDADGNREFKFKNTGKEPLIIYSATGSCGWTVPTAPKDPIKPGESAVIKVHYDTKRPGSFEKNVTVSSNASANPTIVLKVRGTVNPKP